MDSRCQIPHETTRNRFRSQTAMEAALQSGQLDFIGIARPFALLPDLPQRMESGHYQTVTTGRIQTGFVPLDKKAGAMLEMEWYMAQMRRIGSGKQPDAHLSPLKVFLNMLWANGKASLRTVRT